METCVIDNGWLLELPNLVEEPYDYEAAGRQANTPPMPIGFDMAAAAHRHDGSRKTKLVRVKQEYIDRLLEIEARPRPSFEESIEMFRELLKDQPEWRDRAINGRMYLAAIMKACRDEEDRILEQYRAKGYAEEEVEIRD